jgi:hypothetical protein
MHKGQGNTTSKSEAMYIPGVKRQYDHGDTDKIFFMEEGSLTVYHVAFVEKFKYLGAIIHYSLDSEWDITNRINAAQGAMHRLQPMLKRIDIDMKTKGRIYNTLIINILLYGCECWTVTVKQFSRLRVFHARCLRTICRVNMLMTRHKHIPTTSLETKLQINNINYYYSTRLLRWAGHVARMPMTRIPRKLLTGWAQSPNTTTTVSSRKMTWGRTLNRSLSEAQLPLAFSEWSKQAQDKGAWRTTTKSGTYGPRPEEQPLLNDYNHTCAFFANDYT